MCKFRDFFMIKRWKKFEKWPSHFRETFREILFLEGVDRVGPFFANFHYFQAKNIDYFQEKSVNLLIFLTSNLMIFSMKLHNKINILKQNEKHVFLWIFRKYFGFVKILIFRQNFVKINVWKKCKKSERLGPSLCPASG